jgi:hypothetical protein
MLAQLPGLPFQAEFLQDESQKKAGLPMTSGSPAVF